MLSEASTPRHDGDRNPKDPTKPVLAAPFPRPKFLSLLLCLLRHFGRVLSGALTFPGSGWSSSWFDQIAQIVQNYLPCGMAMYYTFWGSLASVASATHASSWEHPTPSQVPPPAKSLCSTARGHKLKESHGTSLIKSRMLFFHLFPWNLPRSRLLNKGLALLRFRILISVFWRRCLRHVFTWLSTSCPLNPCHIWQYLGELSSAKLYPPSLEVGMLWPSRLLPPEHTHTQTHQPQVLWEPQHYFAQVVSLQDWPRKARNSFIVFLCSHCSHVTSSGANSISINSLSSLDVDCAARTSSLDSFNTCM